MALPLDPEPVPIRMEADGTARIGKSRVTLDTLMAFYKQGYSAENLVRDFDTLVLSDVYLVLGYVLRHTDEVDAYLEERERKAAALRAMIEAASGETSEQFWQRIRARPQPVEAR